MSPSPNPIRILTVDDQSLFRNGTAALLSTQPDMSLIGVRRGIIDSSNSNE
jgi:hypothetical protein